MSSFDMSNATYGRDSAGVAKLACEYLDDLEKTKKLLRGDKYTNLLNIIRENWSGEDAEAYIKSLNSKISTLETKIENYKYKIALALTDDYNEFMKFQRTNAQSFK